MHAHVRTHVCTMYTDHAYTLCSITTYYGQGVYICIYILHSISLLIYSYYMLGAVADHPIFNVINNIEQYIAINLATSLFNVIYI
jgi:hypothetical protein